MTIIVRNNMAVLLCVLLYGTPVLAKPTLMISRVEVNYLNQTLQVLGEGFGASPAARLAGADLNLSSVSDASIVAELPGDLADGTYQLLVSDDGDFSHVKKLGVMDVTVMATGSGQPAEGDVTLPIISHNAPASITNLQMPYHFTVSISDDIELAYYAIQEGAYNSMTYYLLPGTKTSDFDVTIEKPYPETGSHYMFIVGDAAGNIKREVWDVNIEIVAHPPVIDSISPYVVWACEGGRVEAEVFASGTDLQYEWYNVSSPQDGEPPFQIGPRLVIEEWSRMYGIDFSVHVFNELGKVSGYLHVMSNSPGMCP